MDLSSLPGQGGQAMANSLLPRLHGKRVTLRRPIVSDIEDRLASGRHAEIIRMYGGDSRNLESYTREDATAWYQAFLTQPLAWVIEHEGKCVGNARLTVTEADKRARYAIGIFDTSKLGQGLGTEATRLILDYAFKNLGLHRVDLRVLEYNTRAIACYEKCGFVKEGLEREGALVEGKWETDVMMSILEQEYSPPHRAGGEQG